MGKAAKKITDAVNWGVSIDTNARVRELEKKVDELTKSKKPAAIDQNKFCSLAEFHAKRTKIFLSPIADKDAIEAIKFVYLIAMLENPAVELHLLTRDQARLYFSYFQEFLADKGWSLNGAKVVLAPNVTVPDSEAMRAVCKWHGKK